MSTDKEHPEPQTPDIGTLGDHKQTPNTVLTHDQIKKRCARYFTKIMLNSSPKELADYFFEMVYQSHSSKSDKRLDVWIDEFDKDYHDDSKEE